MKKFKTILKISSILLIIHCSLLIATAQWVQMNNGIGNAVTLAFAVSGNNLFAGVAGTGGGVYLSSDYGLTWMQTALANQSVYSLVMNGNYIFAGTYGNGIYISGNNGASWTQTTLNNQFVYRLAINGNYIFAGTYNPNNGVFVSSDNGATWTQTQINNQQISSFATSGINVYACTGIGTIHLSTNNGTSWTQIPFSNQDGFQIAINGNNIFTGGNNGVYLSTNNGNSWTQTPLNNRIIYSLAINGNNIFAGTYAYGIYVSTNNGASWTQRSDGLPNGSPLVRTLIIFNDYIFAGLGYGGLNGVYRRPLSELTGIQIISSEIPNKFSLSQNYPNPFNPETNVKFQITNYGLVTLKIYNILGIEAALLVNENLQTGSYKVNWNASNYPSGVYYYKLTSGEFVETKKMILIK